MSTKWLLFVYYSFLPSPRSIPVKISMKRVIYPIALTSIFALLICLCQWPLDGSSYGKDSNLMILFTYKDVDGFVVVIVLFCFFWFIFSFFFFFFFFFVVFCWYEYIVLLLFHMFEVVAIWQSCFQNKILTCASRFP